MNDQDLRERLRSAEWPDPSANLRARVADIVVQPPAIAWSDRVWYSRRWRGGFAAAVLALVAIDLFGARQAVPVAPQARLVETAVLEELVRFAGLPDEAAASIARRAALMARTSAIDLVSLIPGEGR